MLCVCSLWSIGMILSMTMSLSSVQKFSFICIAVSPKQINSGVSNLYFINWSLYNVFSLSCLVSGWLRIAYMFCNIVYRPDDQEEICCHCIFILITVIVFWWFWNVLPLLLIKTDNLSSFAVELLKCILPGHTVEYKQMSECWVSPMHVCHVHEMNMHLVFLSPRRLNMDSQISRVLWPMTPNCR